MMNHNLNISHRFVEIEYNLVNCCGSNCVEVKGDYGHMTHY